MTKTLIFDIETSPNLAYVWGKWKQNVGDNQFVEKSYIMSFAAKWLHDDEIIYTDNRHNDDKKLVGELYDLLDQADVVVAHNGKRFDLPKVLGRGIVHGYTPPSPYAIVDTLLVARKKFAGFDLWVQCLKQNDEAWQEMKEYNVQDILSLEALYLRMLPYMDSHPNVGNGEDSCPNCGGHHLQRRGSYRTKAGISYQRYVCNDCGSWSRLKTMDKAAPQTNMRPARSA